MSKSKSLNPFLNVDKGEEILLAESLSLDGRERELVELAYLAGQIDQLKAVIKHFGCLSGSSVVREDMKTRKANHDTKECGYCSDEV